MPTKSLTSKMYNRGYQSRPLDKPVVSTYTIVEVPRRFLGNKAAMGRVKVCRIEKVEALLTPCVTTGRSGAPDPSSGLDLTYTGFDKGHVIALELGGVDDHFNIIPQCRFFQQSGPWRKAEREILKIIKKYPPYTCKMKVKLAYVRSLLDPKSLSVVVTNTVDDSILFQCALDNMPTDVDKRQQDKVIDKLSAHDDESDDDFDDESDSDSDTDEAMDTTVSAPASYAVASFSNSVSWMATPGPGQFEQQQMRVNSSTNAMDLS